MVNKTIERYVEEQQTKMSGHLLANEISHQSATLSEIRLDQLPVDGHLAIILHPVSANYKEGATLHSHDFFEIIYAYKNTATQHLEHSTLTLEEGSVCLMNTNYKHGISIPSQDSVVFNILVSKQVLNTSFLNLISENDLFNSFFINSLFSVSEEGEYVYFRPNPDSNLELLMQSLIEEYILQKPCYQAAMQSYLSLIFTDLLRNHIYVSQKKEKSEVDFSAILAYITANLSDITLQELAAHFHYTPAYLSKILKKYLGHTFSELLNELKLNRAADCLRNSTMRIDAITELLGYYDRSYFNRVFRKHYGCSPSEFRDKSQK